MSEPRELVSDMCIPCKGILEDAAVCVCTDWTPVFGNWLRQLGCGTHPIFCESHHSVPWTCWSQNSPHVELNRSCHNNRNQCQLSGPQGAQCSLHVPGPYVKVLHFIYGNLGDSCRVTGSASTGPRICSVTGEPPNQTLLSFLWSFQVINFLSFQADMSSHHEPQLSPSPKSLQALIMAGL